MTKRTLTSVGFPPEILERISWRVETIAHRVDPTRYAQEPAYVAAFLGRLDGIVYSGPLGLVEFRSTIVADRGQNSAESKWGADFAITANIVMHQYCAQKGVIGQAKSGDIHGLARNEYSKLKAQCLKMHRVTSSAIVLSVPRDYPVIPSVHTLRFPGTLDDSLEISHGYPFDEYLIDILYCKHGDKRHEFVSAISESDLNRLHLLALF